MLQETGTLDNFQSLPINQEHILTQLILMEREKRFNMIKELMFEKQKVSQLESLIENTSRERSIKLDIFKDRIIEDDDLQKIGAYSNSVRRQKIISYKLKVKGYKEHARLSRSFKGRSIAAKKKLRSRGKFAKNENA